MAAQENKIKYGLSNFHYAMQKINAETGALEFETPVRNPGAVSLTFSKAGETGDTYADDIKYHSIVTNDGYTGSIEFVRLIDAFRKDALGFKPDENGMLIENAFETSKYFACMFEFKGDKTGTKYVYYNCIADRPNVESATRNKTTEPKTETLDITISPLENGDVGGSSEGITDQTILDNWYKSVYMPKRKTEAAT